jgi:hypothetical protein
MADDATHRRATHGCRGAPSTNGVSCNTADRGTTHRAERFIRRSASRNCGQCESEGNNISGHRELR